jgi:hypothetical protein
MKLGFVAAQIFTEIKWNIQRLILEFKLKIRKLNLADFQ